MDKEKAIEKMAEIITDSAFNDMSNSRSRHKYGVSGFYAEALINAGYGNVKQAVKEFAEKLKAKAVYGILWGCEGMDEELMVTNLCIDELFTELYGEDNK